MASPNDWNNALKNMDMEKYRHSVETRDARMKNIAALLTPARCVDIFYKECSAVLPEKKLVVITFFSTQALERYLMGVKSPSGGFETPINITREDVTLELCKKYEGSQSVKACLDAPGRACVAIATFLPGMFGMQDSIDVLSFTAFTQGAIDSRKLGQISDSLNELYPYPGVREKSIDDPKIPCDRK